MPSILTPEEEYGRGSNDEGEDVPAMPEFFEAMLKGLPPNDAKKLWDWLDEYPNAVDDVISVIVDNHFASRTSAPFPRH